MQRYLLIFLGISLTNFTFAQEGLPATRHKVVHGIVNTAVTYGGDDLIKLQFTNASNEKIRAGELLMIGGGILITPPNSTLSVQLTTSYFLDSVDAGNGDASFERYPIELLLFKNFAKLRIGAGISHHLSPKVDLNIDNTPRVKANFHDATGFVVEYDYSVTAGIWLGIRYTSINYSADRIKDVEGDNLGLTALFQF